VPSGGTSCPGYNNNNINGEGEEDTQGGENGTGKKKGTKDRKGKRKGNVKGNSKGNGIVKRTPGGDDISHAVALQLQKSISGRVGQGRLTRAVLFGAGSITRHVNFLRW
jgi:hypothetical protein